MVSSVILIDVVSRLLGVFRFLINPKLLGAEAYGKLGLVSAILIFSAFCDLGVNREYELKLPRSLDPSGTVRAAVRTYLKRALFPSLALCGFVAYVTDVKLALACLPYVIFFGLTEILLIVFRAYKAYWVLNSYSLISATLLTFSTFWIAPLFGVLGLISFQSLVTVLAVVFLAYLLYSKKVELKNHGQPSLDLTLEPGLAVAAGAHWLFFGQLIQVSWLVMDRLYLAHRITPQEMGFWTLGSLPGSMLTGVATTIGALHMAGWIRKERAFLVWSEALSYGAAWLVGTLIYGPFIIYFLPAYSAGIDWNLRLIAAQGSLGVLFFYDCYRRSLIRSSEDSKEWFLRRLAVSGVAVVFLILGSHLLPHMDPRGLILLAIHLLLVLLWSWERKWSLAVFQLLLGLVSLI